MCWVILVLRISVSLSRRTIRPKGIIFPRYGISGGLITSCGIYRCMILKREKRSFISKFNHHLKYDYDKVREYREAVSYREHRDAGAEQYQPGHRQGGVSFHHGPFGLRE